MTISMRYEIEPEQFPGYTHRLYDFGNGFGALAVKGHPDERKNLWELHPVEFPRFGNGYTLQYGISPQIDRVKTGDIKDELAKLKSLTD